MYSVEWICEKDSWRDCPHSSARKLDRSAARLGASLNKVETIQSSGILYSYVCLLDKEHLEADNENARQVRALVGLLLFVF